MAEVSSEVIYGAPKPIRTRPENLDEPGIGTRTQPAAIREHMRGFPAELNGTRMDIGNIHTGAAPIERRVERIEKRLDIVEEPRA